MTLASAIYEGAVRHRRFEPVRHEFRYRMAQLYLDLSELDEAFRGRWLWSAERPNLAWFRRADHAGDPDKPLESEVRRLVEERLGDRPEGPIRLLTHLRYFGYCMNPVSVYYCYDPPLRNGAERLRAVLAEVHNTPWGERHCYALRASGSGQTRARFPKAFHVSPFLPMNHEYDWRFSAPRERLAVHMKNLEEGRPVFDATLALRRRPLTASNLRRVLTRYPLMTTKVIAAIYWQALRLKLKGATFHPHPKNAPVHDKGDADA